MAINKRNDETARAYNPDDAYPDETINVDDHRIFNARLGELLAGADFNGITFESFEVYAHWSDTANGVVITVNARRKLTSAEMGRLADLCNRATPGRPATDVYEEWAATLETPLEYHGNHVIPPDSIWLDLLPSNRGF